jgi:NADH-quinone oxidoreductase subunit F
MTAITTGERPVVRISGHGPDPDLREVVDDADATVAAVGPTGVGAVEPLVAVTRGGETAFHARCSPDHARAIVSALEEGDLAAADPDAVVDHDPGTARLPQPPLAGLGTGERAVLGACGWLRPASADDHEATGGFVDPDPETVMRVGDDLRGRGWGDWASDDPVSETWDRASRADGEAAVVVNAHGNVADTLLLASAPFEALDGATTLAGAVGADRVVVYASSADERAVETAREAVAAYPNPGVGVEVVAGPPEYRAAEPTMALEAIEGNHRLEARLRPPGPDEVGLDGDPTLVHTARTLAHLAVALRQGDLPGTRTVTVTGDVDAPATVELPETGTLREAVDAVAVDGGFKAACVGGRFGGVTGDLGAGLDPETLAGADLGTEGTIEVLGEGQCVVEFVGKRARFAAEENCGRCVPCREGTTQLADQLRAVYGGEYDPGGIEELGRVMDTSSICRFGVDAGRPARTAVAEFDAEFAAHADGHCPAGSCRDTLEAPT